MLAYKIKEILTLVPDVEPFIKKASIEEEFPIDSKDSTLASWLAIKYMQKVAHEIVDYSEMEKVEKAAQLWNIPSEFWKYEALMEGAGQLRKEASLQNPEQDLMYKQAHFEGQLSGFVDLEKVASEAQELYDQYGDAIKSDTIKRYAGIGYLNKEAALSGLVARYKASGDDRFIKVASALRNTEVETLCTEDIRKLCNTVTSLDKQAQISARGFNFFDETVIVKEAELASVCSVRLANVEVPYEKISKLGKDRISQTVGKDVADELTCNAYHDKQVLETLPLDLQEILVRMTKAV